MTHTKPYGAGKLARVAPSLLLAGIVTLAPTLVFASGFGTTSTEVLNESCNLIDTIKRWLFGVVYVLGAIGLVLIAISAFLGRFKFAHLIALDGGLFIVAAADLLIDFITAGNEQSCVA